MVIQYPSEKVYLNAFDAFQLLSNLTREIAGSLGPEIDRAGELVWQCLNGGNKVLTCGNGGSAADAQHFVAELIGRMGCDRRSLPAISLSADPSVVTALANDYGYDQVFARQLEGLGQPDDMLLAISTSGYSANILQGIKTAHHLGMKTLVLAGGGGSSVLDECDLCIHIPSNNAQRVQELHMVVLHIVCDYVEYQMTRYA